MKLIKWIAITFAALVVSCAALAIIGGPATNDQTPTAQPAVTAPTSAPAPTVAPTVKPEPTAAPASDTQDVAEYVSSMIAHSNTIADALGQLTELSRNPLVLNQAWWDDLNMQLATIRNENAALQQITPPTSMQDYHAEVLAGMADYDASTYHVAKAFDTLDKNEFEAATALMTSGAVHINRATAMMKAK